MKGFRVFETFEANSARIRGVWASEYSGEGSREPETYGVCIEDFYTRDGT